MREEKMTNPFENKKDKKDSNFMLTVATFIVDKRNLFFLLYIILTIFSAFSRNWVKVENSLSAYLPETSETSIGLDLMDEQFTTYGSASIMVTNIDQNTADEIADIIENQEEVYMLAYDSEEDYKNFSANYSVTYMFPEDDDKAVESLEKTEELLSDYDVYVSTSMIDNSADNIAAEMQKIIVLVAIIVVAVLFLTSQTYAEVPVLIITFLSSAIVAMGTNYLLGTISFVSDSVTIVLQLALSVDYAIIFCNRYKEEHQTRDIRESVIIALSKAIPEITASSLTTIGGLIAMMFMQFMLGQDLAICLIKAILLSLCSVFLLMPGLLVLFGNAMDKSHHKNFVPNIPFVGKFAHLTRFIIPPLFVVGIVFAFTMQKDTSYVYGYTLLETPVQNNDQKIDEIITETFGDTNMVALCVPKDDLSKQKKLVELLSEREEVDNIVDMTNTEAKGGYMLADKLTPRQFCEAMELDYNVAEILYSAYAADSENYGRIIAGIDTYQVEFYEMLNFLYGQADEGYVTLDDDSMEELEDAHTKIGIATRQLMGEDYNRMLVYLTLPEEGDQTFSFLDELHTICKDFYEGDVYVVGESTSQYDLCKTFSRDNTVVSLVSIIAVLAVLLFTFKSAGMPVLLIIVIQGAIWINFSFPAMQHDYLFFLSYLIVSSIQMGANIDYAIVISSRFMDIKDEMPKKQAIIETMNFAFPTIITSGTMLAMAGILIGNMTSDGAIVGIGQCLGRGTIISIIIVMFILPQILLLGEKVIDRTKFTVSVPVSLKRQDDVVRIDGWFKGKMFSVVIALLLAGSLIAADINMISPRTAFAVEAQSEEENSVLEIKSADDFIDLCKNCKIDSYSEDLTAKLMTDIDLSEVKLDEVNAPLGYLCVPSWNGKFLGNGHVIKGAIYDTSGYSDGLFRFVGKTGTVEKLTVQAVITSPEDQLVLGGIAGTNAGQINDCVFTGIIKGQSVTGGIAGVNEETGSIINSSSHGVITGFSLTGGIVGENHGFIEKGINQAVLNNTAEWLEEEDSTDIKDFLADLTAAGTEDEVKNSGSSDVGGVAGHNDGVISKSVNRGTVGYPYTGYNVGGICGRSIGRVYDCENYGLIQGRKDVGGICGQMEPLIIINNANTIETAVGDLDRTVTNTRNDIENYAKSWEYTKPEKSYDDDDNVFEKIDKTLDNDKPFGEFTHNDTEEFSNSLKNDLDAVQNKAKNTATVMQNSVDNVRNFDISNYYEDISDARRDDDTDGKASGCKNEGNVIATRNAGGIVGSMGIESEDDEQDSIMDQEVQAGSVYQTICILTNSKSQAVISTREDCAGGVCGYEGLGVIAGCEGFGRVKTEEGNYVGGICGKSTSTIRNSNSAANLSGTEFVGGIAGLGRTVSGCVSSPIITGEADRIGGILGQALDEDGNYKVDDENIEANFFVSTLLEGIDSVSYEKMAKKISNTDLLEMPELNFDEKQITDAIIYDEEEEQNTVALTVASDETVKTKDGEEKAVAIVSGNYDITSMLSATKIDIDVSTVMDEGKAECYQIVLNGGKLTDGTLRVWCDGDENVQIYEQKDGKLILLESKVRGKYAEVKTTTDNANICVIHQDYSKRNMMFMILGIIAFGIVLIVMVVLIMAGRRAKRDIKIIKEKVEERIEEKKEEKQALESDESEEIINLEMVDEDNQD